MHHNHILTHPLSPFTDTLRLTHQGAATSEPGVMPRPSAFLAVLPEAFRKKYERMRLLEYLREVRRDGLS